MIGTSLLFLQLKDTIVEVTFADLAEGLDADGQGAAGHGVNSGEAWESRH